MSNLNVLKPILLLLTVMLTLQSCNNEKKATTQVSNKNNYVQIATGQKELYNNDGETIASLVPGDDLYGQDATYKKGAEMAYQNNGDGTITDLNTGLIWQEIPTSEGFDWYDAKEYCENLVLGGYDDWRMPTLKELFSISDFSSGWPYIDTDYFSLVNNIHVDKSEQYWADNPYVGFTEEGQYNAAFGVNHATGHIKAYPAKAPEGGLPPREEGINNRPHRNQKDSTQGPPPPPRNGMDKPLGNPMLKHVRAVRGEVYGKNDFKDNGDGTITDHATGLMWVKADSQKGMNWQEALKYAENLEFAGYSDWRLPNVKELQGIVDYNYAPGAKDAAHEGPALNPMFNSTAITNENGEADYPYYWTSTSARFQKGKPYYYAWYVAAGRAVNANGIDFHGAGAVRFDTKYDDGPTGEGGERYYNYVRVVRDAK